MNLVLCSDGTSNEIAGDATNVLRLFRCLVRSDSQQTFYDAGVGTVANPDRISGRGRRIAKKVDAALGLTVRENALDAYQFMVSHYQPGMKIFLFGFSRGAYAVRAVAGMIHFLGLLRPELLHLSRLAWAVYSQEGSDRTVQERFRGGHRFRKSFSINDRPQIEFMGVWDTVSSFGWFGDLRTLPYTADNPSIRHVRHALAIDERRAMFQANHFRPDTAKQHASIKEVWFAGVHADVGGGYPEIEGTLSKVSLEWMLREASAAGLQIDDRERGHLLDNPPDHPPADPLGPLHESLAGFWHVAELIPQRSYSGEAGRKRWQLPHRWASRPVESFIPTDKVDSGASQRRYELPRIHASVETRRKAGIGYQPRNLPKDYIVES